MDFWRSWLFSSCARGLSSLWRAWRENPRLALGLGALGAFECALLLWLVAPCFGASFGWSGEIFGQIFGLGLVKSSGAAPCWAGIASFIIAYISSALVILSSYHAVQKRLRKELSENLDSGLGSLDPARDSHTLDSAESAARESSSPESNLAKSSQTDEPAESSAPQRPSFLSRFILGVQISFGLYRLLAYIVLIVGVVWLMSAGAFHILGYVAGVLLCSINSIALQFAKARHSS